MSASTFLGCYTDMSLGSPDVAAASSVDVCVAEALRTKKGLVQARAGAKSGVDCFLRSSTGDPARDVSNSTLLAGTQCARDASGSWVGTAGDAVAVYFSFPTSGFAPTDVSGEPVALLTAGLPAYSPNLDGAEPTDTATEQLSYWGGRYAQALSLMQVAPDAASRARLQAPAAILNAKLQGIVSGLLSTQARYDAASSASEQQLSAELAQLQKDYALLSQKQIEERDLHRMVTERLRTLDQYESAYNALVGVVAVGAIAALLFAL